jgi:3-oxoadipate enol-lactonase
MGINKSLHKDMRIAGENIKIELDHDLIINYDDYGPVFAPVVIFIHGSPFNKGIWDLQIEALKNNYRVITFDLRGHGASTGHNGNFMIEQMSDDLVRFMDALKIQKAIICGLSLGGFICLDAVERHPERFHGLILSGIQCMTDDEETRNERVKTIGKLLSKGIGPYAEENIRKFFSSKSFISRREEVKKCVAMIESTKINSIVRTLESLNERREYCSRLSSIDMPVMLLAGREDRITPLSSARHIQETIPHATLNVIEYAGHLANLENTHDFNKHLIKFTDSICKSQHLSRHCEEELTTEVRLKRLKV